MHITSRTARPLVMLVALLALLGLVGAACSDDDGDDTTTTTDSSDSSDADSPEDATDEIAEPEPVSDEALDEMVGGVLAQVESAADACALVDALGQSGSFPTPSTPAQVEVAVNFIAAVANKMAEFTTDAALAEQLRAAGTGYQDFAAGVDYDPESVDLSGMDPEFTAAADFQTAANTWFETSAAECVPDVLEELPEGDEPPANP